jgi:hypothetical protein
MALEEAEINRRYAEAIAPAIVEGLGSMETQEVSIFALVAANKAIAACLGKIDWPKMNLPPLLMVEGEGSDLFPPPEAAQRLVMEAFSDFYELTTLGQAAMLASTQLEPLSVRRVLLDSRNQLLLLAHLDDNDKSDLLTTVKRHPKGPPEKRVGAVPPYQGPALYVDYEGGSEPLLRWHPELEAWMRSRFSSEVGCPAAGIVITEGNTKTSLLHFFWDKLIPKTYPD